MDSRRVRKMTSDTSHQRPAGSSNHAQARSPLNGRREKRVVVHCKTADGCNRHKVARGSGSHRAPSCVADQCQITRLARVPLSVISLSRAPRTWLPGWIPEDTGFSRANTGRCSPHQDRRGGKVTRQWLSAEPTRGKDADGDQNRRFDTVQ